MARFNGTLVCLEETNLEALFYYRYLINSHDKEIKAPPVSYYDNIDKKGIDNYFATLISRESSRFPIMKVDPYYISLVDTNRIINDVNKSVYHGFKYTVLQESIRDDGTAKKLMQVEAKKIKNHEEPYNNIFKKYSVHIHNG